MTEGIVKVLLKSTVPTHYTLNTTPLQPNRLKRLVTCIEPALMIFFVTCCVASSHVQRFVSAEEGGNVQTCHERLFGPLLMPSGPSLYFVNPSEGMKSYFLAI